MPNQIWMVGLLVVATSSWAQAIEPVNAVALDRALSRIDPERIAADIQYISCDEMGGRDTPSEGLRLTARFLRNRLQRLGLAPGNGRQYLHPYSLEVRAFEREGTTAELVTEDESFHLQYGHDYYFWTRTFRSTALEGEIVFCDDLDSLPEVSGKWVLLERTAFSEWVAVGRLHREGAVGLIIQPPPESDLTEVKQRMTASVDRMLGGRVRSSGSQREEGGDPFGLVYLSATGAKKLGTLAAESSSEPWSHGQALGVRLREFRAVSEEPKFVTVENVCGFWEGADPELKHEVILVSAHFDHVGRAAGGQVFNGADDNASGTAGLLAMAEALTLYGPLRRSVMFVWVSGEEKGLLGSAAWVADPSLPDGYRAVADINLDMIARNDPDEILVTPTPDGPYADEHNEIVRLAMELAEVEGFTNVGSADKYYQRSDQYNFAKLGIPVMFLFTGVHVDYHQVTDTLEKLDVDKASRIMRLVLRVLDQLDAAPLDS